MPHFCFTVSLCHPAGLRWKGKDGFLGEGHKGMSTSQLYLTLCRPWTELRVCGEPWERASGRDQDLCARPRESSQALCPRPCSISAGTTTHLGPCCLPAASAVLQVLMPPALAADALLWSPVPYPALASTPQFSCQPGAPAAHIVLQVPQLTSVTCSCPSCPPCVLTAHTSAVPSSLWLPFMGSGCPCHTMPQPLSPCSCHLSHTPPPTPPLLSVLSLQLGLSQKRIMCPGRPPYYFSSIGGKKKEVIREWPWGRSYPPPQEEQIHYHATAQRMLNLQKPHLETCCW